VAVTRVRRAGVELTAVPGLRSSSATSARRRPRADIDRRRRAGNSLKELTRRIHPFFIGSLSASRSARCRSRCRLPQPLRLGWRRPSVVALLLGASVASGARSGTCRQHEPAFREFGIALFFAAVG
jgi:hypothetical protein